MRLRALPQSFWKQPNNPPALSPGNIFSSLPPLSGYSKDDDVTGKISTILRLGGCEIQTNNTMFKIA